VIRRLSLRARLTAAFAAAFLVVLALAAVFVYLRVASDLSGTLNDGLRARADDIAALVTGGGTPELGGGRLVEGDEGFSQVLRSGGEVVASTLPLSVGPTLTQDEQRRATSESVRIDERDVQGIEGGARILARPAESPAGSFVVVTGASLEDRQETLSGLVSTFLIGAPLALLVASGFGYWIAGRSLAPVEAMRRRADEITLERSGERLPLPQADDEIHRLGETLNSMLDRIEASLDRERVFVADASHELRTPLSILRTELELAGRPGRSPEELRSALRSAAEEVDRLSQLAEDLLVIARSDQGRLPIAREEIALSTLLERVRERFAQRAAEAGRSIAVVGPNGDRASLDPLRVEQALGNLVDNALRHGAGSIGLRAARNGAEVLFEVSDEGPGFAEDFAPQAFERFTRADEGRTEGGAGLGLAIARAIAAAHGGSVSIEPRQSGRTVVRMLIAVSSGSDTLDT
jgi:signal transduction histidine kinase